MGGGERCSRKGPDEELRGWEMEGKKKAEVGSWTESEEKGHGGRKGG